MKTNTAVAKQLRQADSGSYDIDVTDLVDGLPHHRAISPPSCDTALPVEEASAITQGNEVTPIVRPVRLPAQSRPQPKFDALQKWEGRVLDVDADSFSAVVVDSIDRSVEEEVEFALDEISLGDRDLLTPGAVFYWSIGYRTEPSGERSRSSVLVFRRLPAWTAEDLARARADASDLRRRLGW